MPYLGNTPEQQAFTPAVDYFSGNGSTTAFTLSRPVASVAQVQVTVENVPQNPGTAYTVSGNTITFDGAPPSGTNNIYVYYTSPITQVIQPGQGTVGTAQLQSGVLTPAAISDQNNTSTGAFDFPAGTTAQRPASPITGYTRYNTTTGTAETYDGTGWQPWDNTATTNIQAFTTSGTFTVPAGVKRLQVLVVAGGGGGGGFYYAGGGGGGGLIFDRNFRVTPGQVITATVGAGGASQPTNNANGNNGSNSVFGTLIAIGGGGGGSGAVGNGNAGGSGGGCGHFSSNASIGGQATNGQGSMGGSLFQGVNSSQAGGGGGGGAGQVGTNGVNASGSAQAVKGGDGLFIPLFSAYGASGYFAGGGGGAYNANAITDSRPSPGGLGGGGEGGRWTSGVGPTAGTVNTGGGGGGGMHIANGTGTGAAGGSGVILVAWYQ